MIIELLDGDKLRGTFVEFDADKGAGGGTRMRRRILF